MRFKDAIKGFTLVEMLMALGVFGVLSIFIYQIFYSGTQTFNGKLWRQSTSTQLDYTTNLLSKLFGEAGVPVLNTFQGIARDKSPAYAFEIKPSTLNASDAYTVAIKSLAGNQINNDASSGTIRYFGIGMASASKDTTIAPRTTNGNAETDIIQWVSCQQGYQDMPGFTNAPPRCGKHRLFLKNKQLVDRKTPGAYTGFQDLILETAWSIGGTIGSIDIPNEKGTYSPIWLSSPTAAGLTPEEKNLAGRKLLLSHVAAVTVKAYNKPNERSQTVEMDFICVAPYRGNDELRNSFQANVGVDVRY